MSYPNIKTLHDGDVRLETVKNGELVVRYYTTRGATIYVIPCDGPRRILMVGNTRHPERLRDGESLEDAVRRLHAPPQNSNVAGWVVGGMLVTAALGGLLVWLQVPFGGGW